MQFSDCSVGMEVIFGRGNGEYTRGIIEKKNRIKAKVRTIENRGSTIAGTVWSVPYSLMSLANGTTSVPPIPASIVPQSPSIKYHPFQDRIEQKILETINDVYSELSPENLTCDGELDISLVKQKRNKLNRQLRGLFQAYGREVDETTVYKWLQSREDYHKEKANLP